jgi:hypothetical protein
LGLVLNPRHTGPGYLFGSPGCDSRVRLEWLAGLRESYGRCDEDEMKKQNSFNCFLVNVAMGHQAAPADNYRMLLEPL